MSRCFATLGFCALRPLALSVRMESYLRIRNNLFLVSFWKRASFHFACRPSRPGKTKMFTLCLNLLVLLGAVGILVRIRVTHGDTQVQYIFFHFSASPSKLVCGCKVTGKMLDFSLCIKKEDITLRPLNEFSHYF